MLVLKFQGAKVLHFFELCKKNRPLGRFSLFSAASPRLSAAAV